MRRILPKIAGKLSSKGFAKEKAVRFFDDIRPLISGAMICGAGIGIISNSGGLFVRPVCDSLNFSRAGLGAVQTISLLLSMITAISFGKRLKRGRIRPLLLSCAAVCCAVSVGYSFCGRLWQFYLLAAINGLAVNGITMLTAVSVSAKSRFGGAFSAGVAAAGAGAASAVMLSPIAQTIERLGWRWGYRLQAAAAFSLLVMAALLLKEGETEDMTAASPKSKSDRGSMLLCIGLFSANFVNMALFCTTAPFFADIGFSQESAAGAISLCSAAAIVVRPLFGALSDRLRAFAGANICCSALFGCCIAALLLPKFSRAAAVYPFLLAICSCANGVLPAAFARQRYDRGEFSAAVSRFSLFTSAATAVAQPTGGFIFDMSGSYRILWVGCAGISILSFMLFFAAEKTKTL